MTQLTNDGRGGIPHHILTSLDLVVQIFQQEDDENGYAKAQQKSRDVGGLLVWTDRNGRGLCNLKYLDVRKRGGRTDRCLHLLLHQKGINLLKDLLPTSDVEHLFLLGREPGDLPTDELIAGRKIPYREP